MTERNLGRVRHAERSKNMRAAVTDHGANLTQPVPCVPQLIPDEDAHPGGVRRAAVISDCGLYRYRLERDLPVLWSALFLSNTASLFAGIGPHGQAYDLTLAAYAATMASANYFLSCSPPTYTQRRQERLSFQPTS
jgi:hypothetical protein